MRRQVYFGLFKARKKELGEVFLSSVEHALYKDTTLIYTSSFSKAQKVAKNLCNTYGIEQVMINIDANIQDYSPEDCIQLLKRTPNSIETLVLIAPGFTMSSFYGFLTGETTFFSPGSASLVEFPLNDWNLIEPYENQNLI
tara:strand:- start:36758 stop:37180 length:423 start_codon:yes stop_codon:yes gene_type:complete